MKKLIDSGVKGKTIDLKNQELYQKDTGSLSEGCECFTCKNHNRAYIFHLFDCHEMNAHVLLAM
jgi:tRNA-guanine family transglycosylase